MYYIIRKFTLNNGEIINSTIGYLNDITDRDSFYAIHGTAFIDWVETNNPIDKTEWFDETNTHFYLIDSKEELPDGLQLITDINNPEGGI